MAEAIDDVDIDLYADFDNRFQGDAARFGVRREAVGCLPVIDVSTFVDGDDAAARARVAREIRSACVNIGFFYITGHGIPQAELDEIVDWSHRFFALPTDRKMALHKDLSPRKIGYMQVGGTNPDANPDRAPDLKENFNMCREAMAGEATEGNFFVGESQWPEAGELPGFETFMKAHLAKRAALTRGLAHGFALSLDLGENFFDESHHHHGGILLLNYYPSLDPAAMSRTQWSNSPHSDYGSFTLLSQDDVGGLQVRNVDGAWIDVPPIADTFVVNIGDLFAVWTNDLYTPNLHRAVNVSGRARVSVPYFVMARSDVAVQCLDTCQGPGNPARYHSVVAGEYVRELVGQSMRTGRAGVSARTADRFLAR